MTTRAFWLDSVRMAGDFRGADGPGAVFSGGGEASAAVGERDFRRGVERGQRVSVQPLR